MRRTLTPAPSRGVLSVEHAVPSPEPIRRLERIYVASEAPAVIPVRPMPDPYPPAHRRIPSIITRPFGPPFGLESVNGGRGHEIGYAAIPYGQQSTMLPRVNLRRPELVEPSEVIP